MGLDKKQIKDRLNLLMSNARWALKIAWETSAPLLLGVLCCEFIVSVTPAAIAWAGRCLINTIVDEVTRGTHDFNGVLPWLVISLGLALTSELFGTFSKLFNRHLSEKLGLKIEMDLLDHSSKLDISLFEDPEFQDIAMRANQDSAVHLTGFLNKVISSASSICKIAGLVTILFLIDPVVVFTITPLVVPYLIFKWSQSKRRFNKEYSRATQRRWTRYYSNLLTNLSMLPEVRLFNLSPELIRKFNRLKLKFIHEDQQIYKREFWGNFIFSTFFAILFYFLFARIAVQVMNGSLTIGDIAIFAGATKELFNILSSLVTQVSGMMEGMLFMDNLLVFFKTEPRIKSKSGQSITDCTGNVEFRNVWFKYPGSENYVLKDVSFRLSPGRSVAIVGRNGAGKSTIIKLLARFYEPDKGEIFIDSININQLSIETLHQQLAIVFQTPNRYEASAASNISCASNQLDHPEELEQMIRRSAVSSGIHDVIEEMPAQYDTSLGRAFGVFDLSGGQWQKIAIARAFMREDAAILILDEPVNGLDVQSRKQIVSYLKTLSEDKSTIFISHRLAVISLADTIIVLEKGEVLCSGTHVDLLESCEPYQTLYQLHTSEYV